MSDQAECPRCKRPFVTVHDVRGNTMDGKCFTQYAPRDHNAAKDCELAAMLAQHSEPAACIAHIEENLETHAKWTRQDYADFYRRDIAVLLPLAKAYLEHRTSDGTAPPAGEPREWTVCDVPMGHTIKSGFVTFHRDDHQPGNALSQLTKAVNNWHAPRPPAGEPYNHERENGERYAAELDKAAELLQAVHPIGKVKGIGRLEVVAALEDVIGRKPAGDTTSEMTTMTHERFQEIIGVPSYEQLAAELTQAEAKLEKCEALVGKWREEAAKSSESRTPGYCYRLVLDTYRRSADELEAALKQEPK